MLDPTWCGRSELSVYDTIKQMGYEELVEPDRFIDKLADKSSIIRIFYKPKYYKNKDVLKKGNIEVYFDIYFDEIDILIKDKRIKTFDKYNTNIEIIEFLKYKEREIKLNRIVK